MVTRMTDLINGMKILNERIDFWVEYILNQEEMVNEDVLFEFTCDIIDEWIADMDIGTYIHDELKEKLIKKGVKTE